MTRVQDMATITRENLKRAGASDVASRAYMVWLSASNSPKLTDHPTDTAKRVFRGTFKSIVLDLYPELSPQHMTDELEHVCSEVYSYLRATGNARCTSRGNREGRGVEWEIAALWKEPAGPVTLKVATHSAPKPTATERKLTPKEAGEDRKPLPVTVTKVVTTTTTETKDTYMTTAAAAVEPNSIAREAKERHREILECIELTLRTAHPQPLTVAEISTDLGIHESTARMALTELVGSGVAFSRTETAGERGLRFGGSITPSLRASLYSTDNPVPERTVREAVRGVLAVTSRRHPTARLHNDSLVLAATRANRWDRPVDIINRAGIPQGSSTTVFKRLVDSGQIITTMRMVKKQKVRMYKRVSAAPPESPPVTVVATPPVAPFVSDARTRAINAVEELLAQAGNSAEVACLTDELASARARIAELERALEPLQALLGRS